jgi:hypothetical protein
VKKGSGAAGLLLGLLLPLMPAHPVAAQLFEWPQHSMERPKPRGVDPGAFVASPPPADAIVLFNGRSFSEWTSSDSGAVRWRIVDGAMEVVAGTGGIETVQGFGDVQVHIEWMAPTPPRGAGQDRGNSGVFLMRQYEVQVLDSWRNDTYADGQAGSIYGQYPPLVNPIRPPGQWQSYDIVFRRPRFEPEGKVTRRARKTVFYNGILVQDAMELFGPTSNQERNPYSAHADRLPISLQDHGHPVRFRNIWVRDLE